MKRFICGVLVIIVTFYIGIIYGSTAITLLGFAEAVFVVLSFCFIIYFMRTIQFQLEVPITLADQGDTVTVRFVMTNLPWFVYPNFQAHVTVKNEFNANKKKKWLRLNLEYGTEYKCTYEMRPLGAGLYEICFDRLRVYDPLGVFYLTKRIGKKESIEIIPKIHRVGVRVTQKAINFWGDADCYEEQHGGYDPSEVFQIRPFQDGDKIQAIHWKLSARTEELMVKESSQPKACPVTLLLEHSVGSYGRNMQSVKENVFLQAVASLSYSMMDAGCTHYVAWFSAQYNDVVRVRIDNEESFYQFLLCYIREDVAQKKVGIEELYNEKYRSEILLHKLKLNSQLELDMDQERIAKLDGKDIGPALAEVELIL